MKLYFILPLLLCFCSQLSSQAYLKTLFEVEWRDKIEDFVNVNDTLVICSNIVQHPSNYVSTTAFFKIDSSGTILDYRQNVAEDSTFFYKFSRTNLVKEANGYIGSYRNSGGHTFVVKFDEYFNIITKHEIPVDSLLGVTFMVQPFRGGYLAAGTHFTVLSSTDLSTRIRFLFMDSLSTVLWDKEILSASTSQIDILSDSTFAIVGTQGDGDNKSRKFYKRFTFEGIEISEVSTAFETGYQEARSMIEVEDGGFVFISNKVNFTPPDILLTQKTIRRMDTEGNIRWTRSFGDEWFKNEFVEMIRTQDGNFVSAGFNLSSTEQLDENEFSTYTFEIVKVDEDGKPLWTTQDTILYNPEIDVETEIKGITELSSGSIVVLGYTWYIKNNEWVASSWMAKYDKDGCKIHGCRPLTSSTELIDRAELSVYPNPTSDFLQIDTDASFTTVAVYDLAGKCVIRMPYSSSIDIQAMPSGIYVLELVGETGVYRTKIVKE